MMPELLTSFGPIMVALTGVLVPVGATGRFVWNKIEKRFEGVEAKLAECELRDKLKDVKVQALAVSITLLVPVVQRASPRDPVLRQVRALLKSAFHVEKHVPEEWMDLLAQIDEAEAEARR